MKVIIVGGVAGGASCAARLRRLDEKAEILMVERGPYVSYANCGLPYHVGGVIEKESSLLVGTEQMFRAMFAIDARTNCEAIAIDPKKKTVNLRNVKTGEVTTESYDKLVLSPGAASVHPPLPGIDLPGIFHVRTVPDARTIREWIEKGTTFLAGMFNYSGIQMVKPVRRAVVVGGGFIGLETAENLVHLGFDVTLIQKPDHVLSPLDPEIACLVQGHMKKHGVQVVANDGVVGFKQLDGGAIEVQTKSGKTIPADIVILAIGVKPDTTLAKIGRPRDRRTRRHPRGRAYAHQRPGHLRRRRCHRGQGLRDRPVEPDCAGRAGEPAGPDRGRCDCRARFPLPGHAGHLDHQAVWRRCRLDRRQRENAQAARRHGLSRRSTCSRIHTPDTTRAPRCSG